MNKIPFVYDLRYGGNTHSLVGTSHVSERDYSSHAREIGEDKKTLLMEVKSSEADRIPLIINEKGTESLGALVKDLGEKEIRFLERSFSISRSQFENVPLIFAMPSLAYGSIMGNGLGIDHAFEGNFTRRNLQIYSLEKPEEQADYMLCQQESSRKNLLKGLKMEVESPGHIVKKARKFMNNYYEGDIEELIRMAKEEDFNYERNNERNERMVGRSLNYLRNGPCVVSVGALHLFGKKGLINLYEKKFIG